MHAYYKKPYYICTVLASAVKVNSNIARRFTTALKIQRSYVFYEQ